MVRAAEEEGHRGQAAGCEGQEGASAAQLEPPREEAPNRVHDVEEGQEHL